MANESASIFSAIAAMCSAISAITIVRIQQKNMIYSSRPDIILEDWERVSKSINGIEYDTLSFKKIFNAGKGPAFNVILNVNEVNFNEDGIIGGNKILSASMSTEKYPIITCNKDIESCSQITLLWTNEDDSVDNQQNIPIVLKIYCWCSNGYRYITFYHLIAYKKDASIIKAETEIAPMVFLLHRHTSYEAVWKLIWKQRIINLFSNLSKLGKYLSVR